MLSKQVKISNIKQNSPSNLLYLNSFRVSIYLMAVLIFVFLKIFATFHYFSHHSGSNHIAIKNKTNNISFDDYDIESHTDINCNICDIFTQLFVASFYFCNTDLQISIPLLLLLSIFFWHKINRNSYFPTAPPIFA
jgi:hypothetical protein